MSFPVQNSQHSLSMPNTDGESGRLSEPERMAAFFGPYSAEQLDYIEGSFRQCIWSTRHQLDNLCLTPEEYNNAGQRIIDRAAEILQVTSPRIRVTEYNSSESGVNININIPNEIGRESLNQVLSLLSLPSSLRRELPHVHSMPYPQTSGPVPPQFPMGPEDSVPDLRPQQQTPGHTQSGSQRLPQIGGNGGFRISFSSPTSGDHAPDCPMMGAGLGPLLGGNPLMNLVNLMGARSRPGAGADSHSDPVGIERLLHMVPTTQDAFKEMENLMVIRGENPLHCFDQEHLIKQWSDPSKKGEVETILQAISKKPDHLKGVDYKELKNKVQKDQGLLFLKSLLKHTDSEPNIQMLVYLKQHGFLKLIEPTPTFGDSRTP